MKPILFFVVVICLLNTNIFAQPGSIDTTFNPTDVGLGDGANSVKTSSIQSDGKIIIGGDFNSYNGIAINRLARLNADGSLDATFNPGSGANNTVKTSSVQSDGKIIIGGAFTTYNGITWNRIARISADGSLDTTFNPGSGTNNTIWSTAIQSDGKIIIGGIFTSFNGTARNKLARINADGSLDTTFDPGTSANYFVSTISIQNDGKIIIGGSFSNYNGTARNNIARINTDGSLDTTFNPGSGALSSWVYTSSIQNDGKIIIGGDFTNYNGPVKNRIVRINSDGSLDTTFNPGLGADDWVYTTSIQSDGKIIIGGEFDSYNGTTRKRITRINSDGTLDTTFNPGSGVPSAYGISTSYIQSDGKIIIGGAFDTYNGIPRNSITRLNSDGSLDVTFNPITGANYFVSTTSIQSDGKIMIGGGFKSYNDTLRNSIARLNVDGSLDTTFNPNTGANNFVRTIIIQNDGKIIIGGDFTSYNGTSINKIVRLNSDGTLDATFSPGTGADSTIWTSSIQSDGKIIIGGEFTSYNGSTRKHIARLNSDGTLDATFNPGIGADDVVYTTSIQNDGKIIIGGEFTSYNGTTKQHIARINADGSLDATFAGIGTNLYFVYTTSIQSDEKIVIGGYFSSYNGTTRNMIARLNSDGSLDATFNPGTGANNFVRTTIIQNDGKIIIGGEFTSFNGTSRNRIARLNSDGLLDATFNPGMGANIGINTISIQSDGKIIIGGGFTSYNGICKNRITRLLGVCEPTSTVLTQTTCDSYTLNGQTYTASGVYLQTLTNATGCDSIITLNLTIKAYPDVNLGPDTVLCINYGEISITLDAGTAETYLWSDSSTNQTLIIDTATYSAFTNNEIFVLSSNGICSINDTIHIYFDLCEGILSFKDDNYIKIYPNPTNKILIIEGLKVIKIELLNIQGRVIKNIDVLNEPISLDISKLTIGIYIMRIQTENGIITKKFIKE